MPFKKGQPKNAGRKAGTPNKLTTEVKQILQTAFWGIGGQRAFEKWAKENPDKFYALWVKVLPKEVKNEHAGRDGLPIQHTNVIATRINALTVAFLDAARREEAVPLPGDGGGKPLDSRAGEGGHLPETG